MGKPDDVKYLNKQLTIIKSSLYQLIEGCVWNVLELGIPCPKGIVPTDHGRGTKAKKKVG